MENKTVNVLGENYSIMFVDEYPELFSDFEETSDALCNFYDKVIYVLNPKEKDLTEDGKINLNKRKLRHEIVHAFLFESGLSSNTRKKTKKYKQTSSENFSPNMILKFTRQKYLKYSKNLKFCRWFYVEENINQYHVQ